MLEHDCLFVYIPKMLLVHGIYSFWEILHCLFDCCIGHRVFIWTVWGWLPGRFDETMLARKIETLWNFEKGSDQ